MAYAYRETYGNRPYMVRKKYADDTYLEVVDTRIKNGRFECLSRWVKLNPDGSTKRSFGYRWRKICGKDIVVPSLGRAAKDDHSLSLTIRNPFNGKMNRAYMRDFEVE